MPKSGFQLEQETCKQTVTSSHTNLNLKTVHWNMFQLSVCCSKYYLALCNVIFQKHCVSRSPGNDDTGCVEDGVFLNSTHGLWIKYIPISCLHYKQNSAPDLHETLPLPTMLIAVTYAEHH